MVGVPHRPLLPSVPTGWDLEHGGAVAAFRLPCFAAQRVAGVHLRRVIIQMIWWTGLAPWEFESPFPGSLTSTLLGRGAEPCRCSPASRFAVNGSVRVRG